MSREAAERVLRDHPLTAGFVGRVWVNYLCGCGADVGSDEGHRAHVAEALDAAGVLAGGVLDAVGDERETHVAILAGVRCEALHGQIVGASCANCRSWAREIGEPFWRPSFAARVPAAVEARDALEALAEEMETAVEYGTMPGVRMRTRQHWARRLRALVGQQRGRDGGGAC